MTMKKLNLDVKVIESVEKMEGDELAKLMKHKHRAKTLLNTYVTLICEDS